MRAAWNHGLVDDKTRINIENVRNEKPQRRRRTGRYVKRNEVRRLFAAAPGTDSIGARDAAMLALLYGAPACSARKQSRWAGALPAPVAKGGREIR